MAVRPVFVMKTSFPYYSEINVEFHYHAGFALVQKQKNIEAIHQAYRREYPKSDVLEASSKAPTELGKSLSPFYLMTKEDGKSFPVENVFQASKVFQTGGPFLSLLEMPAIKAKTTSITKTHGLLLYYEYRNKRYPIEPRGWLYDWIYMNALSNHPDLVEQISQYNAFTDIAFNPKTGSTCQAKCLAIYKSLAKKDLLKSALSSIPAFLKIVFHVSWPEASTETEPEE